jgi:hypothetical protein
VPGFILCQARIESDGDSMVGLIDSFKASVRPGNLNQPIRFRISMRFHPNRRASSDQAPGPSSISARPMEASRMSDHGSPGCRDAIFQSPTAATRKAEIGVPRPASKTVPPAMPNSSGISERAVKPAARSASPCRIDAIPAVNRRMRRPAPGAPPAKVENSRRKFLQHRRSRERGVASNERERDSFERRLSLTKLRLDNPALDADDGCMGTIVGAQLREDVLHSTLDCLLRN